MNKTVTKMLAYIILLVVEIIKRVGIIAIIYGLIHLTGKSVYTFVEISTLYLIIEFTSVGIVLKLNRMNDIVNSVIEEVIKTE